MTESSGPPERWFSFLGLTVVRKADILAAAAFLIAFSAAGLQAIEFLRGAVVTIYHPDTVYIRFERYPNGDVVTRLFGQVSFANAGTANASAVIRDISIEGRVVDDKPAPSDLRFEQYWSSFVQLLRQESELLVTPVSSAHPIVIGGNSAASEMVSFAPRPRDCPRLSPAGVPDCATLGDYVSDVAFLSRTATAQAIVLTFRAHLIGKRYNVSSTCEITITPELITFLAENNWYSARCADYAGQ